MKVYISNVNTSAEFKIGDVMDNIKERKVKIQSFEWFNLLKNVANDSVLDFKESTTDYSINISAGNYSADELADELQLAMNTAIGGSRFTVTYNTRTFKFDFVNSTNNFRLIYGASTIMRLIGFSVSTTAALTVSSDSIADLSPIDCIYVVCSLVNDATINSKRYGILWKFQVDKKPGEMIFYNSSSNDDWSNIYTPSNEVRIELRDRDMNVINSTGINWNMSLLFK